MDTNRNDHVEPVEMSYKFTCPSLDTAAGLALCLSDKGLLFGPAHGEAMHRNMCTAHIFLCIPLILR